MNPSWAQMRVEDGAPGSWGGEANPYGKDSQNDKGKGKRRSRSRNRFAKDDRPRGNRNVKVRSRSSASRRMTDRGATATLLG